LFLIFLMNDARRCSTCFPVALRFTLCINDLISGIFSIAEPLGDLDVNIPGQTVAVKATKLPIKRKAKKADLKEPRDCIFYVHGQKCRRGLVLNAANITGEGDAACFALPFRSRDDTSASVHLKRLLAYLNITNLSTLNLNIEVKTRVPEAGGVSRWALLIMNGT
jgi:hypothetical protein